MLVPPPSRIPSGKGYVNKKKGKSVTCARGGEISLGQQAATLLFGLWLVVFVAKRKESPFPRYSGSGLYCYL